ESDPTGRRSRYAVPSLMLCAACGSENLLSARFCQACGARVSDSGAAIAVRAPAVGPPPPPPPPHSYPPVPRPPAARPVLFLCPRCGRPGQPVPYFNRGVNVAKALFLMIPLSFLGPVLLFFLRKDRLICSACKGLLATEMPMPLLQGIPPEGRALAGLTVA